MKHTMLILFLAAMQSASAQITFGCQTASDSTLQAICGTTNPENGCYADEYGQIWSVWCRFGIATAMEDGSFGKVGCFGYCAKRVNLSPVRRLPMRLKPVISQAKIGT